MKSLSFVLVGLIAASVFVDEVVAADEVAKRPNILFCLADDWGWPHAGMYGDQVVETPAFDRLAKEGVLFTHTYVSAPSCTPSRNAIITGQQFYRLEEGANLHSALDIKFPNFMMMLEKEGYRIGHWRKAWGPGKWKKGGYDRHPCGPASKFDVFLKKQPKGKPFCFWFGTYDPHRPYKTGSGRESGMDIDRVHVPDFLPEVDTVRSDIADYYWEVQRWNRDVAKAIELLEKRGELDNTIIIMSGDHGMPFPRCKGNLYDWGVRVPLAVRWGAKVPGGRTVSDFVSFTDFAPTILDAAGVDVPASMTGRSLVEVLQSGKSDRVDPSRDFMVFGRERHTPAQESPSMAGYPARAIRTDRWLYIMNLEMDRWPAGTPDHATHPMTHFSDCDGGPSKKFLMKHGDEPEYRPFYQLCFAKRPAEELYDCQADPDQVNNLAGEEDYREIKAQLREKLVDYLRTTEDPRFTEKTVQFDDYPYRAGYKLNK